MGCHRGMAADSGRAPVPDAGCSTRACHRDLGEDSVRLGPVRLAHRSHPDGRGGTVSCAACHTHRPGSVALVVDTASCMLCHERDLAESGGGRQPRCRSCHAGERGSPTTSQGVPIPHAELDSARAPCTRCHYQLVAGNPSAVGGCARCHSDTAVAAARDPDSAHARHAGLNCRSCHEPVVHRVAAMSTSVVLACGDCHAASHRRPIPADTSRLARCSDCHAAVHAEEQRLILGLVPGEPIRPSPMFVGGVTCRSCHVTPGRPGPRPGRPLVSNGAACTGCHGAAWRGTLGRWQRAYQRRDQWVSAYVEQAARAAAGSPRAGPAGSGARQGRALLAFLRAAGPLHNLPASDRIMRRALQLGSQSFAAAGVAASPFPELGPPVVEGSCVSCHYGVEEVGAGRDSVSGRRLSHETHVLRANLSCDACHAVGAPPPGLPDSLWIDTTRLGRGGPPRRMRGVS